MSNDKPRLCYYCDEPIGEGDWCWIKTGPDGSGSESLRVHDTCAAPLIEVAKKIRQLIEKPPIVDPVPEVIAKLEEAGLKSDDLDDMVHEVTSNAASGVNNEGMAAQARYLMSEGYDPLTLLET